MNQRNGEKSMTKAGRPTFKIVPERLRELRERTGLSQKALAELTFGPPKGDEGRSRAIHQQRVESKGNTSKRSARALANKLAELLNEDADKTFVRLCGGQPEPPPDRVDEIENQLRAQLSSDGNALLQQALERHNDTDNPVRELASDISTRLEVAQLEQRSDELKQLTELTGWTAEELQRPTSLQGYWLLVTNTYGHRETQIVLGVSEVLYQVTTEGAKWLDAISESDARVELSEDAPWLRVRLQYPSHAMRYREFSFVRCAPSATGLQWVKPTEWDRWTIDGEFTSGLKDWAFQHANFVKGFKADDLWPRDVGRLRLLIRQWVKPANPDSLDDSDRWRTIAVHRGCLNEIDVFQQERRASLRAQGEEHLFLIYWLAADLWEDVLFPLLSPIPAAWWWIEPSGSGVRISTKNHLSLREMNRYGLAPEGREYFIRLVEETETGELRRAPWRQQGVQALVDVLQKNLKAWQENTESSTRETPPG